MTYNNSKKHPDWGVTPQLTAQQIIEWLEGHRELMMEIWRSNEGSREKWLAINKPETKDDPE